LSLQELFSVLKDINTKISKYREAYIRNKYVVKESIVAPIIRSLGWDPSSPDKVLPMYKCLLFGLTVHLDYALIINNKVKAGIIVKELDSDLDIPTGNGTKVKPNTLEAVIVTNGIEWHIYRLFKGRNKDKVSIVKRFKILISDTFSDTLRVIDDLLSIMEPNLLVEKNIFIKEYLEKQYIELEKCIPLDRYDRDKHGMPRYIILLDKRIYSKTWRGYLIQIARLLYRKGFITREMLPIRVPHGRTYIISETPRHLNGKKFRAPVMIDRKVYVESFGNSWGIVRRIKYLVQRSKLKLRDVKVCL